jgi:hypothetical protein
LSCCRSVADFQQLYPGEQSLSTESLSTASPSELAA